MSCTVNTTVNGTGKPSEPAPATPPPATDPPVPPERPDAAIPPGLTSLYVTMCTTTLAAGDPKQALRFYTEISRSASDITVKLTPLIGWSLDSKSWIYPPSVSLAATKGAAVSATSKVETDGSFTAHFGTVALPPETNSISGKAATIDNFTLQGQLRQSGDSCAQMTGHMTTPYSFDLEGSQSPCLIILSTGGPLPSRDAGAFHCP